LAVKRHIPRRRFGQHFLVDEQVIRRIIAAIDPQPDDSMVEIGPGLGALTTPLLARLAHLHVVELDRDIVTRLKETYPPAKLEIHAGDALDFDFSSLGSGLRVVGNLPYNISTPILFHLARHAAMLRDVHVMLQKEVVARIVAHAGTAQYGRLSVMLQYHFDAEPVLDVPASAFRPAPKVESAVVRLAPRRIPIPCLSHRRLAGIVQAAFSRRRKTLRNALRSYLGQDEFAALALDPLVRPQELRVEDFVGIANHVAVREGEVGSSAAVETVTPPCAG
jgi:16S rRNA (adenine1518-N6/adenine1519-N6)-dimethyltransferase